MSNANAAMAETTKPTEHDNDATACATAKSPSNCRRGFDASLYFIGRIRTPWHRREDCPKNARESDAVCTVELDPRWAAGL